MSLMTYPRRTAITAASASDRFDPDHPYPSDGIVRLGDGTSHHLFLGHPDAPCAVCDKRLGSERSHPRHIERGDLIVLCHGGLMKLVR